MLNLGAKIKLVLEDQKGNLGIWKLLNFDKNDKN